MKKDFLEFLLDKKLILKNIKCPALCDEMKNETPDLAGDDLLEGEAPAAVLVARGEGHLLELGEQVENVGPGTYTRGKRCNKMALFRFLLNGKF